MTIAMSQHEYPSMHDHGDEQFVTAVAPEHYHSQSPYVLKQPPNAYSYPAKTYYSAAAASPPVASSPETRMSVSGSSTGSYSIPHANFDPAIPHHEQTSIPATNGRPQASPQLLPPSRPVTGVIAEPYTKEGQTRASWSPRMSSSDGHNPRSHHEAQNTVTVYTSDKEQVSRREPNAVLVLLLFSAPIPVFSMGTAIYTFFALFIVIFTSPLRLCPPTRFFRSTTFSTQLCQLLAPALRYHERLAQSSRSDHHYHHSHHPYTPETSTEQFAPLWSSLVLTLAPFLSFGLLLAAWTAAFFWIFAMILGNPDGTEKKDDGRVAVLGVNAWWQTWLRKSRRRQ